MRCGITFAVLLAAVIPLHVALAETPPTDFYASDPGCRPILQAVMPMQKYAQDLTVPVEVNHREVQFALDLGNSDTAILKEGKKRLGLPDAAGPKSWKENVPGGVQRVSDFVAVDTLRFAGTEVGTRIVPVRDFGYHNEAQATAVEMGVIGTDMLLGSDLDLDIPHMRLSVYRFLAKDCQQLVPPWTRPFTRVPVAMTRFRTMSVPIKIEGNEVRALFDTGAARTSLHWTTATLFGGTERCAANRNDYNITVSSISFGPIAVGPLTVRARCQKDGAREDGNSLLGMDVIGNRRYWVSFSKSEILVQN